MILAIETATEICGAALVEKGKVIAAQSVKEKHIHSERLLPMIDRLLKEGKVTVREVDTVAVSIGPGSFTGLRIGLSTAKGLAYAMDKELAAVPTLDALAYEFLRSHGRQEPATICPLIDAKRDEAFFALYSVEEGDLRRTGEFALASLTEILEIAVRQERAVFVADGFEKIRSMIEAFPSLRGNFTVPCTPAAVGLLAELRRNEFVVPDFSLLEPMYIRDFNAKKHRQERFTDAM